MSVGDDDEGQKMCGRRRLNGEEDEPEDEADKTDAKRTLCPTRSTQIFRVPAPRRPLACQPECLVNFLRRPSTTITYVYYI